MAQIDETIQKFRKIVSENPDGINIIELLKTLAMEAGEPETMALATAYNVCSLMNFAYTDMVYPGDCKAPNAEVDRRGRMEPEK